MIFAKKYKTPKLLNTFFSLAFLTLTVFSVKAENGDIKWTFHIDGITSISTAIALDGTIYVSADNRVLYSLEPDGSQIWSYELDQIYSQIIIGKDETIYLVSEANVAAIDSSGKLKWTYANESTGSFLYSALSSAGRLYVATGSELVSLDLNGEFKWSYPIQVDSHLLLGMNGDIYLNSGNAIVAISNVGFLRWSTSAYIDDSSYWKPDGLDHMYHKDRLSSAVIDKNGVLYVVYGFSVITTDINFTMHYYFLCAFDFTKTTYQCNEVAFAKDDYDFYPVKEILKPYANNIGETGRFYWYTDRGLTSIDISSPSSVKVARTMNSGILLATDNSLIVANSIGENPLVSHSYDGTELWVAAIDDISELALGIDGSVYASTNNGRLVAIESNSKRLADSGYPKVGVNNQNTGENPNQEYIGSDMDGDGVADIDDNDIDGDGVINVEDLYPFDETRIGDLDRDGIPDPEDDDIDGDGVINSEDRFPYDATRVGDIDGDGIPDLVDDDMDGDGVLNSDDRYPTNANESADFDNDYIPDNRDEDDDNDGVPDINDQNPLNADIGVEGLPNDGEELWRFNLESKFGSISNLVPAISDEGNILFTTSNNYLVSIAKTGDLNWSYSLPEEVFGHVVLDRNGVAYVCASGNLYAINYRGQTEWAFETVNDKCSSPVLSDNNRLYFESSNSSTSTSELTALNLNGEHLWQRNTSGGELLIDHNNNVLVANTLIDKDGNDIGKVNFNNDDIAVIGIDYYGQLMTYSTDYYLSNMSGVFYYYNLHLYRPEASRPQTFTTTIHDERAFSAALDSPLVDHEGTIYSALNGYVSRYFGSSELTGFNLGSDIFSLEALTESGALIARLENNRIETVNSNGLMRWGKSFEYPVNSVTVGHDGVVYAVTESSIYAIKSSAGPLMSSSWPKKYGNLRNTGQSLDFDVDNIPDFKDPDDDNDGVLDTEDDFPLDETKSLETLARLLKRDIETGKWTLSNVNNRIEIDSSSVDLSINPDWSFQVYSDINGDGEKDVLLRHKTSGQWYAYLLLNDEVIDKGYIRITSTWDWQLEGSADFNGDGKSDLLLRHKNGHWILYFMDGRTVSSYVRPELSSVTDWEFKGTGDFNGDGKADVVVQHKVRKDSSYMYLMDDGEIAERGYVGLQRDTSINWDIVQLADMDGDKRSDIIKRNKDDGSWAIQYMNGRTVSITTFPEMTKGVTWHIAEVADFDGNGELDLLMQNSISGKLYQYFFESGEVFSRGYLDKSTSGEFFLPVQYKEIH